MSRADSVRRRAARKQKSLNRPARQEQRRQREEKAEDRRQETLRANRQKWADCAYHGQKVKTGDILYLEGYDTYLSADIQDTKRTLSCSECGGTWWHTNIHPS